MRKFWIGRCLFHFLRSRDGFWTITRGDEQYIPLVYVGWLDRREGRAGIIIIGRWQLMFARA